jgi:hypothetical protein
VKIIDIAIRQFLGLESLDLHLQAPINVIIGENEAGKSSIRDAISSTSLARPGASKPIRSRRLDSGRRQSGAGELYLRSPGPGALPWPPPGPPGLTPHRRCQLKLPAYLWYLNCIISLGE